MIDQSAKILTNEKVADNTFLLTFQSVEIAERAEPGQFVMVQVSDGLEPLLRRPFSVCSVEPEGVVVLLYKKVGTGTRILSQAGPGAEIRVLGPLGKGFKLPGPTVLPVLISGGIGAAPLIFLARSIENRGFIWFAGYRSATEIAPFSRLGVSVENISIATEDGGAGRKCLVTELLESFLSTPSEPLGIFSCGPAAMLKQVAATAERHRIAAQVSVETAMACGIGACQGCTVAASRAGGRYRRVCVDGPVFDSADIDWSML